MVFHSCLTTVLKAYSLPW